MRTKKVIGIVLVVLGAICLYTSHYINQQVMSGRVEIYEGQKKVDKVNSLFSGDARTKPIGEALTSSGQRRINEGTMKAEQYAGYARFLKILGYIFLIGGVVTFFLDRKKHAR